MREKRQRKKGRRREEGMEGERDRGRKGRREGEERKGLITSTKTTFKMSMDPCSWKQETLNSV